MGGERGKVGEKRKIGITHEREEERARCFLPSSAKRGDIKKAICRRRHGRRKKREKGVEDKERERKKKKSDNNLLFVVTATKLLMKPEPGSSCLSGSGVSGP